MSRRTKVAKYVCEKVASHTSPISVRWMVRHLTYWFGLSAAEANLTVTSLVEHGSLQLDTHPFRGHVLSPPQKGQELERAKKAFFVPDREWDDAFLDPLIVDWPYSDSELEALDNDHDGLANGQELVEGTHPYVYDSDGDGLSDGEEVDLGLDPLSQDSDGDSLTDYDELVIYHTDPSSGDSDGDSASDDSEVTEVIEDWEFPEADWVSDGSDIYDLFGIPGQPGQPDHITGPLGDRRG